MAKLKISLPDDLVEKYNLHDGDKFRITSKKDEIHLKKVESFDHKGMSDKRQFNVVGLILASIIATFIFYIYIKMMHFHQVSLTGNDSIASALITLGAISGMIMFSIYFILNRKNITTKYSAYTFWRTFPVIVISFVLILSLVLMVIAWGMSHIFIGVTFGPITSIILFFVFMLVVNYVMIRTGIAVNYEMLTTTMLLVIVSGGAMSMAANGRNWWQHNLSFLGTKHAHNSWQFNLTVVFASLLMIALVDYIFVSLRDAIKTSWRTIVLRILLTLTAVDLGLVGIFPDNANFHDIHVEVSTDLVYFIVALIVGIRWLLPEISKRFLFLSYAMCVGLVIMDIMFKPLHLISLTAFELSACVLAFGWILILFDTMIGIIEDAEHNRYELKIEIDE